MKIKSNDCPQCGAEGSLSETFRTGSYREFTCRRCRWTINECRLCRSEEVLLKSTNEYIDRGGYEYEKCPLVEAVCPICGKIGSFAESAVFGKF